MTEESPPPASADSRLSDLERRLAEQETVHHARLAQSELKAHALRAGMVDLDGLKLLDATTIKLNAKGEVEGGDLLMAALRRSKPWLFHSGSSSTAATTPPTSPPVAKRATAMSHAEWQAARAELVRRR